MLLYGTHGWIHLSIGRADRWFRWGMVEFTVTALLFVLALPWAPVGIAMAWAASFVILTIPALWYAGRPIQLGISPVIAAVWKYLLASLLAGGASIGIVRRLSYFVAASDSVGAVSHILMISLVFWTFYVIAVILLHRGLQPFYQVADVLRDMVPSGRLPAPAAAVPATGTRA